MHKYQNYIFTHNPSELLNISIYIDHVIIYALLMFSNVLKMIKIDRNTSEF